MAAMTAVAEGAQASLTSFMHNATTYVGEIIGTHASQISGQELYAGVNVAQLNTFERLWMSYYQSFDNPVVATGIMSFLIHEVSHSHARWGARQTNPCTDPSSRISSSTLAVLCLGWLLTPCLTLTSGSCKRCAAQLRRVRARRADMDDHRPRSRRGSNNGLAQSMCLPRTSPSSCLRCVNASAYQVIASTLTSQAQIYLFHPMATYFGMETWQVPFPSPLVMAAQITLFFFMEDTWHYWAHRLMHHRRLYKYVHKIHHEYSAPFGLAAEYAHPIEVLVLGTGTVGSPLLYCALNGGGMHIITMYIWIVLRLFQAIDAHSGYQFPWSLNVFFPLWAGADHHDFHHQAFTNVSAFPPPSCAHTTPKLMCTLCSHSATRPRSATGTGCWAPTRRTTRSAPSSAPRRSPSRRPTSRLSLTSSLSRRYLLVALTGASPTSVATAYHISIACK